MRNIIIGLSLCLLLLILAASFIYMRSSRFKVVHPWKGDIVEAVYGLGKVKSDKRYEVIIGVLETVSKRYVSEGQFVKKGAPLIRFEEGIDFRAPFDGTITLANLYAGEVALPHTPLIRLEDLTHTYIELSLEQQAAIRVRVGQKALVSFETVRGQVLIGRVKSIFPRNDEFIVNIEVSDLEKSILPGMTADVAIEIGTIQNATLVPLTSLQNGSLTIRRDGHWIKKKFEVGHIDGEAAEIIGDELKLSDEIRIQGRR